MRATLLRDIRLIAITDSLHDGIDGLTARARSAVEGGVTMILVRLEMEPVQTLVDTARALRTAIPHIPVLVNSRADIALAADAAGVYLATDDISPDACRRIVPAHFVIGASVAHKSESAGMASADFVGIGPVFGAAGGTDSGAGIGLHGLAQQARRWGLPAVAVGGINPANVASVMEAGASGVAAISAVFGSANPAFSARVLRDSQDAIGT